MSSKTESAGKRALTPKLRFPAFLDAEAWRVTKLNALLFETKQRNRTLELGPSDVLSVSGEHGCVNQIEYLGRSYAGESVKDYHVVEHGDVVYTKSPLKRNPYGIIKENKGKRGIVSTLYAVYRPFPVCSATYLDHFFSVDFNLNAYLQPIVRKGAKNDMKVNNADVLKGDICVPELPEQQKIADCLTSVDELIATQAQKVDALKAHKRGLMQQLFPREGETQPRLRFPEFRSTGEWGQKVLGDVVKSFKTGKLDANAMVESGQYRFYTCARTFYQIDKYAFEGEALLVAGNGAHLGYIHHYIGKFNAYQRTYVLQKFEISVVFLKCLLERYLPARIMLEKKDGNTPYIVLSTLTDMPLLVPKEAEEQQRIADSLGTIDAMIEAQTQKLEAIKTHKKGLMQRLFPSVGEADA